MILRLDPIHRVEQGLLVVDASLFGRSRGGKLNSCAGRQNPQRFDEIDVVALHHEAESVTA